MESPFKMVTDLSEVENAYYVEVKPGEYNAKYWNKESVYFADEAFSYFYTTLSKFTPGYNPKEVIEITKETWLRITDHLQELAAFLSSNPPMIQIDKWIDFDKVEETYKCFDRHKKIYIQHLIQMINEFTEWITKMCESHSYITILGT